MAKLSRREVLMARRVAARGPMAPPDDQFRERHPLLFDMLTRPLVVGGKVLEMPSLRVQIGDGDWQLTLSDGVLCQSLTVREDTLESALAHLEHLVASEDARWSVWKGKEPRLPKTEPKKGKKKVDREVEVE